MTYKTTPTTDRITGEAWEQLAAEYRHWLDMEPSGRRAGARRSIWLSTVSDSLKLASLVEREVWDRHAYVHAGVTWQPTITPEPYASFESMQTAHDRALCTGQVMYVSTAHCEHHTWDMVTNVKFRVWHDTEHLARGLSFSPNDELELARRQIWDFRPGSPFNRDHDLTDEDAAACARALFSESVYQLAESVVSGQFPSHQLTAPLGEFGAQLFETWITESPDLDEPLDVLVYRGGQDYDGIELTIDDIVDLLRTLVRNVHDVSVEIHVDNPERSDP